MAIADGNAGIGQVAAKQAMALAPSESPAERRPASSACAAAATPARWPTTPCRQRPPGMIGFATSRAARASRQYGRLWQHHATTSQPPPLLGYPGGVKRRPSCSTWQPALWRSGKSVWRNATASRCPPAGHSMPPASRPRDAAQAAMVLPLGAKGSALSLVMSVLGGFLVASGQSRDSDLPDLDYRSPRPLPHGHQRGALCALVPLPSRD